MLDVILAHVTGALVAPRPAPLAIALDSVAHTQVLRMPDDRNGICGIGRDREDVVHRMWGVARPLRECKSVQLRRMQHTCLEWFQDSRVQESYDRALLEFRQLLEGASAPAFVHFLLQTIITFYYLNPVSLE